jgi:NAD(P)H dehydrogenase (quinone)
MSIPSKPRLFVTGATGQLGRLVVDALLQRVPASTIVAGVRDPAKAGDLAARGVELRVADYDRPETLAAAFAGIDRVLLISGNAVGQRSRQHGAVIDAAKAAGVKLIAYTSILRADVSKVGLAVEHRETEQRLAASGVPYVLLRNGWYIENFESRVATALQFGSIATSAIDGRFSAATRADYAAGAAVLASEDGFAGEVLELAGSTSFSMDEFAAAIGRAAGRTIQCQRMGHDDYKALLQGAGLPEFVAEILANSDTAARDGWLEDDSRTLEKLIGRPTTPVTEMIARVVTG